MAIDREKFFKGIRSQPFPGSLSASAVQGINAILDEWDRRKLTDLRHLAYMLATVLAECGRDMLPVREGFKESDAAARAYVKRKGYRYAVTIGGNVYYGRGLVQLTWDYNYRKMGGLLGLDLYRQPDLALLPQHAAAIMFEGMIRGTFTGKKLADYFGAGTDWVNARRIINGTDRANEIAGYAKQFHADLVAADSASATAPAALPVPTTAPADAKDVKQAGGAAAGAAVGATIWQTIWGSGAIRVLIVAALLFAAYWFIVRPVLRRMSALDSLYAQADGALPGLLAKIRLALKGVKTLLWGRFLGLAGAAGGILQYAEVIDFSAILPPLYGIPAAVYVPMLLGPLLAIVTNTLRKVSNTSAGQTDLALAPLAPLAPQDTQAQAVPAPDLPAPRGRRKRAKAA